MIRIDEATVQSAKALDLNISKICEDALAKVVDEENRPFGILTNQKIILNSDVIYLKKQGILEASFSVSNTSDENVIFDRLIYNIFILCVDQEKRLKPDPLQFYGTILERETIQKGSFISFSKLLEKNFKPETLCSTRINGLSFKIFAELFIDTRRGIARGGLLEPIEPGAPQSIPIKTLEI
jgi:hypothetical protein